MDNSILFKVDRKKTNMNKYIERLKTDWDFFLEEWLKRICTPQYKTEPYMHEILKYWFEG